MNLLFISPGLMKAKTNEVMFGLIALLVSVGVFATMVMLKLSNYWEMRDWHSTPATVITAFVDTREINDVTHYKAIAEYRYETNDGDGTYTGNRLAMRVDYEETVLYHRLLINQLERNSVVFYDPRKPQHSIFNRDIRLSELIWVMFIVVIFGTIGFAILYTSIPSPIQLKKRHVHKMDYSNQPEDIQSTDSREERSVITRSETKKTWVWIFAFFWALITFPIFILIPQAF